MPKLQKQLAGDGAAAAEVAVNALSELELKDLLKKTIADNKQKDRIIAMLKKTLASGDEDAVPPKAKVAKNNVPHNYIGHNYIGHNYIRP